MNDEEDEFVPPPEDDGTGSDYTEFRTDLSIGELLAAVPDIAKAAQNVTRQAVFDPLCRLLNSCADLVEEFRVSRVRRPPLHGVTIH